MAFLLLQLKLYSAIELSGDEPISSDHHHSRYDKKNQQQQDAPEEEKIQVTISTELKNVMKTWLQWHLILFWNFHTNQNPENVDDKCLLKGISLTH